MRECEKNGERERKEVGREREYNRERRIEKLCVKECAIGRKCQRMRVDVTEKECD